MSIETFDDYFKEGRKIVTVKDGGQVTEFRDRAWWDTDSWAFMYPSLGRERGRGITPQDVEPEKFIKAFSQHLKRQGRFELPKWADVVKTSKAKELPPSDPEPWTRGEGSWYVVAPGKATPRCDGSKGEGPGALMRDWLYVRTASMVRKIYIRKGMGVGGFRTAELRRLRGGIGNGPRPSIGRIRCTSSNSNLQDAWITSDCLSHAGGYGYDNMLLPQISDLSSPSCARKVYGCQQRRGTCTNVFTKSSGKIARYILQQLEEAGHAE
eukprot:Skav228447  [mRNA]  locus=scaffold1058:59719:61397:- [translate_table: standard]